MKKKGRIVWITTQFPKDANSRNGMFIYRTVKELSKYYPITVLCLYPKILPVISMIQNLKNFSGIFSQWKKLNPSKPFKPDAKDKFDLIFIRYFRPPRGKFAFFEGYFAYVAVRKKLKRLLEQEKFLIHANWLFPEGKTAELLSRKFKLPYIITLRGNDVNKLEINSLNYKSAVSILKNSVKVISVSKALLERCEKLNLSINNKKAITHNFYETDKFVIKDKEKTRENLGICCESKILFYAGGLNKRKNVDILIKSVYQLYTEGLNLKLYIAGSGYEESFLRNLVFEKKISDRVFFVGSLGTEKMIEYFNMADLFCLVSKSEGLPNVVVESLLCGTPVLATSVGEIPSLINEGQNGFLTEPGSVTSLSEKIKKSLSTKWDRNALRESMNFLFTNNVLEEYKQLYGEFDFFVN